MNVPLSVKLFGTEEPVADPVILAAGPLEATFDAGNLRYIKVGGVEALRGVAFLVRDRNWGTYNPTLSNLVIEQDETGFVVTYDAACGDADQSLRYAARIEGRADGSLDFTAEGETLSDFLTARTGFVVLHPLAGIVGMPVLVEHTDGSKAESRFPERIDPMCPFQDVRALTHQVSTGVNLVCRMEGDAFEMEDHRNWMDASYKTYSRPLALPWPFTMQRGEKIAQRVGLSLEGALANISATRGAAPVSVAVGPASGHAMPRIGLAAPAGHLDDAIAHADLIRKAEPSFLVCHFDARQGDDAGTMTRFAELGAATGAPLVLEAVVPCLGSDGAPTDDLAVMRRDLDAVGSAARQAGIRFERVAVSPACDLKCTLPGSVFPPAPGWDELIGAAREIFPDVPVGGGMFSYFTELNRKRPPTDVLDFLCHSGCPIVHAGDDVSMTETLEALPSIFHSARALSGGKPYWILPTAISMRDNPYGAVPAENPDNIRQAMNRVDPRERGLIGAAWYAGYIARASAAGLDAVTLAAVAGPSGMVYVDQPHAQPGFDDNGAAILYPHFHVIAGLAALRGEVLAVDSSDARAVQAVAVSHDDGTALWLCNLTGTRQSVDVSGLEGAGQALVLDEGSFAAACADPDWRDSAARLAFGSGVIELGAYAVAEVRYAVR